MTSVLVVPAMTQKGKPQHPQFAVLLASVVVVVVVVVVGVRVEGRSSSNTIKRHDSEGRLGRRTGH